MGEDLLTPGAAMAVYRELCTDARVRFAHERAGVEMLWMSFMAAPMATGSVWTDAWLAAFALSQGIRLVTFDAGMQRWAMLDPEILRP
jgi:predicted nucleic acid-binding protein